MTVTRASMKVGVLVLGYLVAFSVAEDGLLQDAGKVIGRVLDEVNQCGETDIVHCLKERALRYLDSTSGPIVLSEGVVLKETPVPVESAVLPTPAASDKPRARENTIDSRLMDRLTTFLASRTLEFQMPKLVEQQRDMDADEGRKKKKKLLLPILLLLKLKALALLPLLLGGIALISLKSLVLGKVALVITVLVALKKLLEVKESQTYEVVAHPHHSHSHVSSFDDHHGHFRRAWVEDTQSIPYSAYVTNPQIFGTETGLAISGTPDIANMWDLNRSLVITRCGT